MHVQDGVDPRGGTAEGPGPPGRGEGCGEMKGKAKGVGSRNGAGDGARRREEDPPPRRDDRGESVAALGDSAAPYDRPPAPTIPPGAEDLDLDTGAVWRDTGGEKKSHETEGAHGRETHRPPRGPAPPK